MFTYDNSVQSILNEINNTSEFDDLTVERMLAVAVRNGHTELLDKLLSKIPNLMEVHTWMIHTAMVNHRLIILDWVYSLSDGPSYFDPCILGYNGHLSRLVEILTWFNERPSIRITYTRELFVGIASNSKFIAIMTWFIDNNVELKAPWLYELVDHMCSVDNVEPLQWWYDKCQEGYWDFGYSIYALDTAINMPCINVIKWWVDHSNEFELKCSSRGLYHIDLSTLEFLAEHNVPIIVDAKLIEYYNISNRGSNLAVLNYFYDNRDKYGFPFAPDIIDAICKVNNRSDTLEWWLERYADLNLTHTTKSMDYAVSVHILNTFYKYRDTIELKYTHTAMDNAINDEIRDWWFDNRFELEMKYTEAAIDLESCSWWLRHENDIQLKISRARLQWLLYQKITDEQKSSCIRLLG
jgi:hypothetical protein